MDQNKNYMFPKKSDLKKINISDIKFDLPDLKNATEPKATVIGNWLAEWIKSDLASGKICINNVIPSKSEFAYLLGVSIGTMQNAFRYLEDIGYVESKQCIGTMVKDYTQAVSTVRKLTSKRDLAADAIKSYIKSSDYKVGDQLPSSANVASIIDFAVNTTRLALETLSTQGILEHNYKSSRDSGWIVANLDFEIVGYNGSKKSETLVDMVVKDLEDYIVKNLKVGDKMPAHAALAKSLKASLKTVHDALAVLISKGILLPRRGRYGTSVVRIPNGKISTLKPESSIFAPAQDTAFYHYEKTQNYIKRMIAQDYQIGDKLPSIQELSVSLDLSPNTIRKAFHNLADEGYLVFSRGRYGGTFVIDIPEVESQAFKWLAVNPEFAKIYQSLESN